MAIGNSSGVYVGELDLSQVIANASTAVAAIVFASTKGRTGERIFISSTKQFIDEFGTPDPKVSYAHYAALAFLEEGNQLWAVRVVGSGARYAGAVLRKLTADSYSTVAKYAMANPLGFDPATAISGSTLASENLAYTYAIGPGEYAANVAVEYVSSNMYPVANFAAAALFTTKFLVEDNYDALIATPIDVVAVGTTNIATLTGSTVVGGVTPVNGSLVLLTAQTDTTANGLYLTASGAWVKQPDPAYVRYTSGPAFYRNTSTNVWTLSTETIGGVTVANNDLALFNGQTVTTQCGIYKFATATGIWTKQADQPRVLANGKLFNFVKGNYILDSTFAGGTLIAATYNYKITATNSTGETLAADASVVIGSGTTNAVALSWDAVIGATGYRIYGRTTGGSFGLLATTTQTTYTDSGVIVPLVGTVQQKRLPPTSYAGSAEFTFNVYDLLLNPSVPVETFKATLQNGIDGFGRQTEFAAVVNNASTGSKYVRVVNPAANLTTVPPVYSVAKVALTGGAAGASATDSDIINGWSLFSDKEQVSINILINGGYASPAVQLGMDALAQRRMDCIAILDLPTDSNVVSEAVDYRNNALNLNSSYSALYGPDLLITDTYNGTQLYVPPSGHVAAVYARTDRVSDPWFAPAGLNRGLLSVLGLRAVYNEGDREQLQQAQVNYVRKFPGMGYAIMEAYTLQAKLSALSFVPVRRMLMVIESAVSEALLFSLWEPNDPIVRMQIVNMIADYLDVIQRRRGINRYMVVCDDTNNSANTTANGTLNVDVYVEPTLPVARISLRMVVTKQGMSFEEAVLMGAQA